MSARPDRGEAAEYYVTCIDRVAGHVTHHLAIIRQRELPPPLTHRTDR